jgi:hypothetical protein
MSFSASLVFLSPPLTRVEGGGVRSDVGNDRLSSGCLPQGVGQLLVLPQRKTGTLSDDQLRDAREPPRDATKRRERLSDGDFLEEDLDWMKMRRKHRGKTERQRQRVCERDSVGGWDAKRCYMILKPSSGVSSALPSPQLTWLRLQRVTRNSREGDERGGAGYGPEAGREGGRREWIVEYYK